MLIRTISMPAFLLIGIASFILASDAIADPDPAHVFGVVKAGYLKVNNESEQAKSASAIGGKLGLTSSSWNQISLGTTVYASQSLFDDEQGDFFNSKGDSYLLLGEAFVQYKGERIEVKLGRFEFDSPHADTDDIRMVSNVFSGLMVENTQLPDTRITLAYLDKWAGGGADTPESFTDLTGSGGLSLVGAEYVGWQRVHLQAWYYHAPNYANLLFSELSYEVGSVTLGAQLANQTNKQPDQMGPDGDAFGLSIHWQRQEVNLTLAYNGVSGVVHNGFGGGPFYTSSADHTIERIRDQGALAFAAEYTGVDGLILGLFHADFVKGASETDYYLNYRFKPGITMELIYHHMHDDGDILLARFNAEF